MTLSNMFSQSQKLDKELRLEVALLIEALVKTGKTPALDLAELYGKHYLDLEEKISKHDYSKEDELIERADKRLT